jgi:hypothetical protein
MDRSDQSTGARTNHNQCAGYCFIGDNLETFIITGSRKQTDPKTYSGSHESSHHRVPLSLGGPAQTHTKHILA